MHYSLLTIAQTKWKFCAVNQVPYYKVTFFFSQNGLEGKLEENKNSATHNQPLCIQLSPHTLEFIHYHSIQASV